MPTLHFVKELYPSKNEAIPQYKEGTMSHLKYYSDEDEENRGMCISIQCQLSLPRLSSRPRLSILMNWSITWSIILVQRVWFFGACLIIRKVGVYLTRSGTRSTQPTGKDTKDQVWKKDRCSHNSAWWNFRSKFSSPWSLLFFRSTIVTRLLWFW